MRLTHPSAPATGTPVDARPSPKGLDYLEAGYLLLLAAFVGVAWLGFTLAELGLDHPWAVLGVGALATALAVVRLRHPRWRPVTVPDGLGLVAPLGIGAALDFPPDEWVLGGLDPGSYVSAGATIARTHGIVLRDALLGAMDPATRYDLFALVGLRLPGFYMGTPHVSGLRIDYWTITADTVVPHGLHLYPVVLAFGYSFGGVRAELLVTPVLALFALGGFYLLVRRLFGTAAAAIAAAFLALSPAQVWFARYPAAEILAQLLLFGGLLALVAALDAPDPRLAGLAGFTLGAVHLAKIETFPLPVLVAGFFGYLAVTGRFNRRWTPFLVAYGAVTAQAVLHAAFVANWYVYTTLEKVLTARGVAAAGALTLLAVVAALVLWRAPRWRHRLGARIERSSWPRGFARAAPVAIGLGAAYLYVARPIRAGFPPGATPDPRLMAQLNEAQSFVRLGWYVGTLGLLLGTLGWMLIAFRERDRRVALPLLLIAADTVLFLDHPDITPVHYWAARRWITLVIPGFCLATGYLLARLFPRGRDRRALALLPVGLMAGLAVQLLPGLTPLAGYVEYRGAIGQLGALAGAVPPNAVVLFPDGDAGERLSTPLNYLDDRASVLVLNDPTVQAAAAKAARAWLGQGRPVYWIEAADGKGPGEIGLRGAVVGRQRISLVEKLAVWDRPPGADGLFQQDLAIWKVEP